MRISGDTGLARAESALRLSGVSLVALVALAGAGQAGGEGPRFETRCMVLGSDGSSIHSLGGCLSPGSHIRVEAQVMQGSASLNGGLPGVFSDDGPSRASYHSEPTTRMRMGPARRDRIYAR